MSLEKIVIINSANKDSVLMSNSDFTVTLLEKFYTQNVVGVVISDCIIPNCFYNIRDGTSGANSGIVNNVLTLSENGGPNLLVTLPGGQYNTTTLIAALTPLINAVLTVGNTVTIVQDPITQLLTFTFTTLPVQIISNTKVSLATVLGFFSSSTSSLVDTAQFLPDLSGLNNVFIYSEEVADVNGIDGMTGLQPNLELVSFTNVPFGAFAYKQNNDTNLAKILFDQPRNLNRISITLKDAYGNTLNIGTKNLTIVFKVLFCN